MTRIRNRKAEPYSGLSHCNTPCYLVKVGSKALGHAPKVRRCHGGPRLAGLRGFPGGGWGVFQDYAVVSGVQRYVDFGAS